MNNWNRFIEFLYLLNISTLMHSMHNFIISLFLLVVTSELKFVAVVFKGTIIFFSFSLLLLVGKKSLQQQRGVFIINCVFKYFLHHPILNKRLKRWTFFCTK